MDRGYVISAKGLRKSYGEVDVLKGVNLRVESGSMLALLGPNGAGKTTIVRILSTLLGHDGGTATVAGYDIETQGRSVRRMIGFTGQQTAVDGLLTGYENLVMMGRLFRIGAAAAKRRANELLEQFDLVDAAGRQVKTYSGGMRRRLDLAISLITAPPVLFLDEPTTGLDPRSRNAVWSTVRELLSGGVSVLLTTQYLEEADHLADVVAVIDGGHVVAEGTADELKQRVGSERLQLTFADTEELTRACAVLGKVDRHESGFVLSVPVDGAKDVRRVLNELGNTGIDPLGISLTEPTLDDVFLTLTGQSVGIPEPVGGVR